MAREIDLISREDAEALFRDARKELFNLRDKFKTAEEYDIRDNMLLNAEQIIHILPSVNPTKTGRREYNDIYDHYLCENCKTVVMDYDNYCPNCGCRMVESQESEG